MTDETIRSKTRVAIWLAIAITLVPLVPYALRGNPPSAPAPVGEQMGMTGDAQSAAIATAGRAS